MRVIGVCDSRSLVAASDVLTTELNDKILLEICHVKLGGGSLSNLSNFGNSTHLLNLVVKVINKTTYKLPMLLQVINTSPTYIYIDTYI